MSNIGAARGIESCLTLSNWTDRVYLLKIRQLWCVLFFIFSGETMKLMLPSVAMFGNLASSHVNVALLVKAGGLQALSETITAIAAAKPCQVR